MKNYLFKYFIVGFIGMSVVLFSTTAFAHQQNYDQCNENNPENCPFPSPICDNGEHVGNPHCDEDVTPTVTITPIPTEEECYEDECEEVTPSPTITPEVTATPEATVTPVDEHHEPSDEKFDIHGDGLHDNSCSKPPCVTQPEPTHYPGYEQTIYK